MVWVTLGLEALAVIGNHKGINITLIYYVIHNLVCVKVLGYIMEVTDTYKVII